MLAKLNALKHGAFSKQSLLPGESAEELQKLKEAVLEDLRPEGIINTKMAEAITACLRDIDRVDNMWGVFFGSHPIARMLRDSNGKVTPELEAHVRKQDEQLRTLAHGAAKIDLEDKAAQREHKEDVKRLANAMEQNLSLLLGISGVGRTAVDRRQEICANLNRLQAQFYKNRDFKRADNVLAKCKNAKSSNPAGKSRGTPISEIVARRKAEEIDEDEDFE